MHRVWKSCCFFQVILILDQVQLLVSFFLLLAIPCNKRVARTSFIQRIRIEIPSICISVRFWGAKHALLLMLVLIQILYVASCLCPGVGQNSGSNPVGATAAPLKSVMLLGGWTYTLCVSLKILARSVFMHVLHMTSAEPGFHAGDQTDSLSESQPVHSV